MVKSFKADLRQGGNTILDDVYVRGCLYVSNSCGIIIQDKANPNSSGRLYIEDNTLKFEIIGEEGSGNPGTGGGSGSSGGTISVGGGDKNEFLMADGSLTKRFISNDSTPPDDSIGNDGDIYLIVEC